MKALERDRDKRYATAAEFADSLERAARVVGTLAAPREVATYIEAVIGTEISQQREAVRAWLARSEPSRNGPPKRETARPEPMSETKVEGTRRRDSSQPTSDSSVSSAVVEIPPEPTSKPSGVAAVTGVLASEMGTTPLPQKRRSRLWPAVVALLVVGAAGGVIMTRWQGAASRGGAAAPAPGTDMRKRAPEVTSSPSAATPATNAPATEPATIASDTTPTPAPTNVPTSVPANDASAPTASSAHAKPPARTLRPSSPSPPKPDPALPSVPAVPDDITKNPYR